MYIKTRSIWIEIFVITTAAACLLGLLVATLGVAAGAAQSDPDAQQTRVPKGEQVYEGMVTCSRCEAKHSAALAQTADVCVRVCVHGGAKFALVNADVTYLLDGDSATLKKLAGQRARVVGALSGKTIKVSSAAAQT